MRKSYKEIKKYVKTNYIIAWALTPPDEPIVNAYRIFRRDKNGEMYLLRNEDWKIIDKFIKRYICNNYKHKHIEVSKEQKRITIKKKGERYTHVYIDDFYYDYRYVYTYINTDIWENFLDTYEYDYWWDDEEYEMMGDCFDDPQINRHMNFYKIS